MCFHYLEYHTDKKLHKRRNKNGKVREYIINPYQLVAKEGKYYLICNYDKYDDISNYPILSTYVQITMGKSTNGQQYTMLIPGLEVIYKNAPVNPVIPGDVNGDGLVSSVDVTALYNYLLNSDATAVINGDQDGDGVIPSVDITIIYNILLGISK